MGITYNSKVFLFLTYFFGLSAGISASVFGLFMMTIILIIATICSGLMFGFLLDEETVARREALNETVVKQTRKVLEKASR